MMKKTLALAATLALSAPMAMAREPGSPPLTPTGATVGIPTGAAPPPGFYFSINGTAQRGNIVDGSGHPLPVKVKVAYSVLTLQYAGTQTILGGRYSALAIVPFVHVAQTTPGGKSSKNSVGDISLIPLNLTWMVRPGIFVSTGLTLGLPTGSFDVTGVRPNIGSNSYSAGLSASYSYLRDGWNLTAQATYYVYGKNKDTDYHSGNEIQVDWTAMKDLGGFSAGLVGYGRWQLTNDRNHGAYYGGTTLGKAGEVGMGLGVSTKLGKGSLSAYYMTDIYARNTLENDGVFKLTYAIPLGK
ncbi:transporter [Thioclava sp. BHET1]|nr:transporter [Thioclava sp. BHET1]